MNSESPMKVHLYKVNATDGAPPLRDTLNKLRSLTIEQRLKFVSGADIRLEEIHAPASGESLWKLDLCKLRNQGPGKASQQQPTTSFQLQQGERFSEETALIYDEKLDYLVLQYNHYGPRATAISNYLSLFLPQGFEYWFAVQLDPTAQARFMAKKQFTRMAIRVAPAKLSAEWRKANISMYKAFEADQVTFGGDWISVEISLQAHSQGTLKIMDKVKGFFGLADESEEAVSRLVVAGRNAVGENVEDVDLLTEKLEITYKSLPLDTGLRVSAQDRWTRLGAALAIWKDKGVL